MIPSLRDSTVLDRVVVTHTFSVGGKTLTLESGRLALFAHGSIVITDESGNFLLTTTGVGGVKEADFFPLSVEFQEKYYANGKIGGNRFMKREGRPSDTAILTSRLIDRPIRPMFPKYTRTEVQIISTIMSSSGLSDFGFYGIMGASLSTLLAGITEFEGPVAGVRICLDETGAFLFDPTFDHIAVSRLDLTIAGTMDAITMVESQGREVDDETMIRAFEFAHQCVRELCQAQMDFLEKYRAVYPISTTEITVREPDHAIESRVEAIITSEQIEAVFGLGKIEFHDAMHDLVESVIVRYREVYEGEILLSGGTIEAAKDGDIAEAVKHTVKEAMRSKVLSTKTRLDGRALDQVRPVRASASILPRTHGSGLFERGVTQVLSVATLGGPSDIQIIDGMYEEDTKRYIHHYNFPPFSVGEVKPLRGVSRREVGHGRLAEKALEPVLPSEMDFPYMIRVVSETTTCNGSSSMASVCGSSLALMDAGVPIRAIVAGVAMGMIYDEVSGDYEILSDIQAQEDFLGDLDFKVARTEAGITALQMDCKIAGLSMEVVRAVFAQSRTAIGYIMGEMQKCLATPRSELSPYAPFLLSVFVPEEKMREVIGKGGETIQWIEKNYGVEVDLQDDGKCTITAKDQAAGKAAQAFILNILKEIEVGDIYEWKIIKVLDTVGAIVELMKGKEGMIHISKFGVKERIADVNTVAKVGEVVTVRVYNVDKEKGRIGLEKVVEGGVEGK